MLPVDEMFFRPDFQLVAQNPRTRMRRGPQSDDLRTEVDKPVVLVVRLVVERDVDGHELVASGEWRTTKLLLLLFFLLHHDLGFQRAKRLENIGVKHRRTDVVQLHLQQIQIVM